MNTYNPSGDPSPSSRNENPFDREFPNERRKRFAMGIALIVLTVAASIGMLNMFVSVSSVGF